MAPNLSKMSRISLERTSSGRPPTYTRRAICARTQPQRPLTPQTPTPRCVAVGNNLYTRLRTDGELAVGCHGLARTRSSKTSSI
jgi:hypothetical protein